MSDVEDLCSYLDAGPTPHHVVAETVRRLDSAGFGELHLDETWSASWGRHYVRRDGSIFAWQHAQGTPPTAPFRIVGAHTDSPGFRIKPRPDTSSLGWRQLGVEVYGGPLLNSWLDRDLGIAGRVAVRGPEGTEHHLVRDDRAILRIAQLAIHLDRAVNEDGLVLDRQRHLAPVWGLGSTQPGAFRDHLAALAGVEPESVEWWDIAPFDLQPATRAGRDGELLSSARLDNLVSCHAAIAALCDASVGRDHIAVVALFDHEEVGSATSTGAAGGLLATVLERIGLASGADRAHHLQSLAGSHAVSSDMAHATHPNYPERHEPTHPIALNAGPAIKVNAQQRYATDSSSVIPFLDACRTAQVPVQRFVSNSSLPCGSTIGPLTAAGLAIPVVDVGVPQLAMHSVRELCGADDPAMLAHALAQYLSAR